MKPEKNIKRNEDSKISAKCIYYKYYNQICSHSNKLP